ncbi:MAG: glycosyltransferase [Bacteroidetes bacterium]|nr:glycosyltransferase [Bacteroidota bacterium]
MKEILFVFPTIASGGAEKNCIQVANYLCACCGYKVTIFVFDDSNFYRNSIYREIEIIQLNIPIDTFTSTKRYYYHYLKYGFLLSKSTNVHKYKLIIAGYEGLSEIGIYALYLKNVVFGLHFSKTKYISIIQTSISNLIKYKTEFKSKLLLQFFSTIRVLFFRKMICCSELIKKEILAKNKKADVTVINNIVDIRSIERQSQSTSQQILSEIDHYGNYFINVGRLSIQKNQLFLLKAFVNICHQTDFNLLIIGREQDEQLTKSIKDYINENKLSDRVFIVGEKINPFPYLKRAKAFVFSSSYEGFPLILLETMILKIPILSTKFKGYDNMLNDNNSILVDENDISSLADNMLSLANNKCENDLKINNAYEFAINNSVEIIGNQYKEFFEKCLNSLRK